MDDANITATICYFLAKAKHEMATTEIKNHHRQAKDGSCRALSI